MRHKVVDSCGSVQRAPARPPTVSSPALTTLFAKRRASVRHFPGRVATESFSAPSRASPPSVNFEFVNKIIIPELHLQQFRHEPVLYALYPLHLYGVYGHLLPHLAGSLESNLMQMVVAKKKLNLFMKGKDADLDEIYDKFGIDYNLMALLMRQELDEKAISNPLG